MCQTESQSRLVGFTCTRYQRPRRSLWMAWSWLVQVHQSSPPSPRKFPHTCKRLSLRCQVSTSHQKNQTEQVRSEFNALMGCRLFKSECTYKAVLFVDFVVWGLDSAAGVHLDTLCWVRIVPTLPVRQKVVLCQNCVSPTSINKDNKEELASTTMMTTRN